MLFLCPFPISLIAGTAIVFIVWTYNFSKKLSKWDKNRIMRAILTGGVN